MNNELTTRQFWLNYWESKTGLVFKVSEQYPFIKLIAQIAQQNQAKTLLEIGGFPGYFSVWTQLNLGLKATLLDYVVHLPILNQLEQANGLPVNTIGVIETDLFTYQSTQKYDLVVSNGLIEHFQNTTEIIQKHAEQLADGGVLLITLPNFKSLNGWFQQQFDPENYAKHHIACMDLALLSNIAQQLGLRNIKVQYNGGFMLWFENEEQRPFLGKLLKKIIWLPLKIISKFIPENKYLSPYIILQAQK